MLHVIKFRGKRVLATLRTVVELQQLPTEALRARYPWIEQNTKLDVSDLRFSIRDVSIRGGEHE
jgi:hypothetical protein